MNKKLILIVLLLVTVGFAGCVSENNSNERELIKVNVVENTDNDDLNYYDFDIIYIDGNGYIKYASSSRRDPINIIQLKQSDDDNYKLFRLGKSFAGREFELHIPKNVTLSLKSDELEYEV